MRWGSSSDAPDPFEVRCSRCDVSFPVETKTCMHCGGPTGAEVVPSLPPITVEPGGFDPGSGATDRGAHADDYDPARDHEGSRGPFEIGDFGGEAGAYEHDGDREAEAPNVMRSILGSLGGLIWIVLFVLFSIARSCGE